jgi:hypothetical protein
MHYNISSFNNEKIGSNREWLIEPDNFTIDDSNHLSLSDCLRGYVFVTFSMKPVCKKICKL